MSIKEFTQKIKCSPTEQKDLFIALIIVVVAFGSFGLGRLSMIEAVEMPIRIDNMPASAAKIEALPTTKTTGKLNSPKPQIAPPSVSDRAPQTGGYYVGSKSGTKYHLPWCSGAERIKEENKVIFATKEEAEKAGYTPAANCKGI